MLAYILRSIAGFIMGYIMREAMRMMFTRRQQQPQAEARQEPPAPSSRSPRIQIDPDNIVDGEFKHIPNDEKR